MNNRLKFLLLILLISCNSKKLVVIDGDSYILDGNRIRLIGVDCPELGQTYGYEAKTHVWNLLRGASLKVTYTNQDHYGRWLANVKVNGAPLDSIIVVNGWGWADTYNHTYNHKNEDLMYYAKAKNRGLWKFDPIEPYKFRRR